MRYAENASIDCAGFGVMEADPAVERGAGVGFQKRAVAGNVAQRGRGGAVGNDYAHPPPSPGCGHLFRYGPKGRKMMYCCHATPLFILACHDVSRGRGKERLQGMVTEI